MPANGAALIERMMAKEPADRIKTPASIDLAVTPHARRKSKLRKTGRLPVLRLPPRSRDDTPIPPALAGQPKPAKTSDDTLCVQFDETSKAKK